ncbi:MAG: HlyC/CorC family transporter [Ectothiorhodospiraceae bacterium]|nr:HlyC/CorC family transporter [Chromatiales bacterium]MCP5157083.1 HlyC/CorC family transporter [Ectothiorhodospiraceae bacterium]
MNDVPIGVLFVVLVVLIGLSAFFSGSETGMMALNRYRLRHLARQGQLGAVRASKLLERPDRLIGLILLGNNLVNNLAVVVATVIALRLAGEAGLAVAPFALTLVLLVFAEVAPKTVAALHPERVAFPASGVLAPLLRACYPLVAGVNLLANGLLRLFGIRPEDVDAHQVSSEELRTVVNEAGAMISSRHRRMLLSILDLERVSVDDIMVPRNEINAIDLEDPIEDLVEQLTHSLHTRLPVYRGDINNVVGLLHMRRLVTRMHRDKLTKTLIETCCEEPYFVPAGTPLHTQLRNFQRQQQRVGLVVDEYGEIEGLVTIEDLLEEIVGEFTTDPADLMADVHPQSDGTFLIDGSANVRELNRTMKWELPTDGPKTVNGLVLEYLESIPEPGTSLLIAGYPVEIVQTASNAVKTARIKPSQRRTPRDDAA